ncbi:MAG: hypothetical protein GYB66_07745 [Chloroflexi bacterium]|nr:hypothetical protein [Chloroflexota bacterium]
MVKLLLSWDILPDRDQEHFEFMIREFAPRLTALGVKPIEAWFTLYGRDNNPQIVVEAIADDLQKMRDVLATEEWQKLKENLLEYVTNFNQKVIRGRPHLQL